jgi:hypothetical protein
VTLHVARLNTLNSKRGISENDTLGGRALPAPSVKSDYHLVKFSQGEKNRLSQSRQGAKEKEILDSPLRALRLCVNRLSVIAATLRWVIRG